MTTFDCAQLTLRRYKELPSPTTLIDLTVSVGDSIGNVLAKACETVMALAIEEVIVYKAAVTCAVALACSIAERL